MECTEAFGEMGGWSVNRVNRLILWCVRFVSFACANRPHGLNQENGQVA